MSYPYPQIGIVGGENFRNKKEFNRIFAKIIDTLQPVVVHIMSPAAHFAIEWLSNYAKISYKVWHQTPTMAEFCRPLHGIIVVGADSMEYQEYCITHRIGLITITD